MGKFFLLKLLILCILLQVMFISCSSIHKSIDIHSLNSNKKGILKDFTPGSVEDLAAYIDNFNLEKLTKVPPDTAPIAVEPLTKWHLKSIGEISYEKWIFKSSYFTADPPGNALFYILGNPLKKGSKVILFVPGFGVSDFAFNFIKKFFNREINAGFSVVVYIPPYHMDRQGKGLKAGEGLITSSPLHNVKIMVNSVKELRMVYSYLKSKNVKTIGAWGGSMGGALSVMLQSVEHLDHLALMIPVLDWNTFITPEDIFQRYEAKGFSKEIILQAYRLISPVSYKLNVPPDRIQIEAALYDQLTPIEKTLEYSKKHKTGNLEIYKTGHATILLDNKVYRDYASFIGSLGK